MVVAMIVILSGVIFVAVSRYLRSMAKLQYDSYAKEIFVAAQNHLAMAESQGYLGRSGFGTVETAITGQSDTGDGVYYFVANVDGETVVTDESTVLSLMLPTASVDDTVRLNGSYIVRYHRDSGLVLDVFYWSESAGRYPHTYESADYAAFLAKRADKDALKTYESDKAVIGYYGGVTAASLTYGEALAAPTITVRNAEKLTVTVTDPNMSNANAALKLIITGLTSGSSRTIMLNPSAIDADNITMTDDGTSRVYTVVLDDVTTAGLHFYELFCSAGANDLIPGENVSIRAMALNNAERTNVAYSAEEKTNSLFGKDTDTGAGTAQIANIRHLENLGDAVSHVASGSFLGDTVAYSAAEQSTDLSWSSFFGGSASIVPVTGSATDAGYFLPVTPGGSLDYRGGGHRVTDVAVNASGSAGLFGSLSGGSVTNLILEDFRISGTDAGALAGATDGTTVTGVLARSTSGDSTVAVSGSGSVGGLIGSVTDGTVEKSAAALAVSSTTGAAGGLIGSVSGGTVRDSYSGGFTTDGVYSSANYNVTADSGSAGGLIGSADGATVQYCYSTSSASGGDAAGGLVGSAANGSISGSYAVGLVGGSGTKGAFAGTIDETSVNGSAYLDVASYLASDVTVYTGAAVGSGSAAGLTAMDRNIGTFNTWAPQTGAATPYDAPLRLKYGGKFDYQTISQLHSGADTYAWLTTHCGDWPAAETLVKNAK